LPGLRKFPGRRMKNNLFTSSYTVSGMRYNRNLNLLDKKIPPGGGISCSNVDDQDHARARDPFLQLLHHAHRQL
jgi:hypothetical protein